MNKIYFVAAVLFLTSCAAGKYAVKNATDYAKSITVSDLKAKLAIVASDEMEGRETGTAGQRRAAAYIENEFKNLGLTTAPGLNGYQQFYPLYSDSLVNSSLTLGEKNAKFGEDYLISVGSVPNSITKTKELVFVGYGIDDAAYSDYKNVDVKGKTVVFVAGEPAADGKSLIDPAKNSSKWAFGYNEKLKTAKQRGALAALVIYEGLEKMSAQQTSRMKSTPMSYPSMKESDKLPFAMISPAFAEKITGKQFDLSAFMKIMTDKESYTKAPVTISSNLTLQIDKNQKTVDASNVVGVIEGTDRKDEYVFLTAHYDHLGIRNGKIYNGADDDGSGTVGVMEMAEAFMQAKKAGKGPRRTVIFMTVSGEEKGLWGSQYYSENPFYPIEKTSVDLNTDMVGRVDTERSTTDSLNYVYVVGHDKISSDLPKINEKINSTFTHLTLDYKYDDPNDKNRIYYRSDHYNFAKVGIPILFFYDGMLKADYHKPTDTIEKINYVLYQKRVQMIFYTAWEMANRDKMLKRDLPLPTGTR